MTDQNSDRYARGHRRLRNGLRVKLAGRTYCPGTPDERARLLDSVGDCDSVYCVEVPAGVLIAAKAGDADGHAVIMTGVVQQPLDSRLA